MTLNFQEIGRLTAVRRDILRKVRQVGVLQTIKHGMRKLIRDFKGDLTPLNNPHAHRFDEKYGTDTAKSISVGALERSGRKARSRTRSSLEPSVRWRCP